MAATPKKSNLLCILICLFSIWSNNVFSQCGASTPTFIVNLTGSPDSVWTSPNVSRNDNCCGTSAPDKCVCFIITLDPDAEGISFNIVSGAVPGGALFYQVGCGTPTALGSPICLSGVGPHIITFCKPGNNANTYQIASIPGPTAGDDLTINEGCTSTLVASGYNPSTVTWTSIFPGTTGTYNSYLSCTSGCLSPTVTPGSGFPPFVDYMICGNTLAPCSSTTVCDTMRVFFNPTLSVSILPTTPTVCFGSTTTTITANATGGTPPYTYLWNTGATTSSLSVGVGTYSVVLGDASGCLPASASVTVTAFTNPITANAGTDIHTCFTSPTVTLNGSVTGTTTGIWSGGSGTFTPGATTLHATYTPTAAEIAAGSVTLTLTTTNNGSCPGSSDNVTLFFDTFDGTLNVTGTPVLCFGSTLGGSATATPTGTGPYTYNWTNGATSSTISGIATGTYGVVVTDAIGCTASGSFTVTQPPLLSISSTMTPTLCSGSSSGSASVTVAGGTPGYTYTWSPGGATTSSISGLAAGLYTCLVSDANGCLINANVTVTSPATLSVGVSQTPVSCFGGSNGIATATPTGGTSPYTYSWSPSGSTSASSTGLIAGSYTVTVSDANGCTAVNSINVTQPTALAITVTDTDETCAPLNNGSANAIVSGGTAPYTYSWSPGGASTSTATGLASGTYTVVATDNKGCQITGFATIAEPSPLSVTFSTIIPVTCFGTATGGAIGNVTGGTPGYSYSWSPSGGTGISESGLTAGTYTLTATDANGCLASNNVTITQPTAVLASANTTANAACFGSSDGSISGAASGGTAPYTFSWSVGFSTATSITGLPAGTYTLTVTDANGCTDTDATTITQPADIILTSSSTNATCSTANGTATISATGGSGSYTYLWTPTGGTSTTATGLAAGPYVVYVTDNSGCVDSATVTVNDNGGPTAVMLSTTNVSCFGGSDGTATVGFSGGTGPYSIDWFPYGGTAATATGLIAGSYTATITDANGCIANATTSPVITQPNQLFVSASATDVTCFGSNNGTATVMQMGGTPGYTYLWTGGMTASSVTGLSSGTYIITVTDANDCSEDDTVIVTQPTALVGTLISSGNVSCFGGSDGTGTVSASGATPGYTYSWSPYGGTLASATGLTAGTYTVTITDTNACSTNVVMNITEPATGITATASSTPTLCNGGSNGTATAIPIGGTPGYNYVWSPGGATGITATGLSAGSYTVAVTDAEGCTSFAAVDVTEPSAIVVTVNPIPATCGSANGSTIAAVSGGTGPYTYSWTPSGGTGSIETSLGLGTYNVLVTDANGCTQSGSGAVTNIAGPTLTPGTINNVSCFGGNDGTASIVISGGTGPFTGIWTPSGGTGTFAFLLSAGTYTYNVTDANGCTNSINATVSQPTALDVNFSSITNVSCNSGNDGSITALASGGTSGYTYSWSPSGGSAATANTLATGMYTVMVTDAEGCSVSDSIAVTEPSALVVNLVDINDPSCNNGSNGSAEVIAGGGTAAYSYSWNTTPVQTGPIASGLSAGTYTVTATDNNGCSAQLNVTLNNPIAVTTLAGIDDTLCLGNSVSISAAASGGSGSYFYNWTPGSGTTASITVSPNATTAYIVTAYDNNGCSGNSDTLNVVVYNLTGATFDVFAYSPICPGISTTVYAQISDDQGPITYSWNNGLAPEPGAFVTTPTASPTYYICTVTNACGSTVIDTATVTFNPPPTISFTSDTAQGCSPLTVTFTDFSSTVPTDSIVVWNWDFGDGTTISDNDNIISHTYTATGTYNVTLDLITWGGCTNTSGSTPYVVTVFPKPDANFTVSSYELNLPYDNVACINSSTGAVSYLWNFGDGTTATSTNVVHTYGTIGYFDIVLTATNSFGCSDTHTETVHCTSEIVFPNAFTPDPNGSNGGDYNITDFSNNVFFPFTSGVDKYRLLIFNRWGEIIFESTDVNKGWDGYYRGVLCTQDVYIWKADVTFIDGREFSGTGDITLLR